MSQLLPDFLVLGPPRCATTWLHACMSAHPAVFMPDQKQLHFFDRNYERGLGWYASFFEPATAQHVRRGEATPDYLATEGVLERIHETLGPIKGMIVYRDPAERAFNHYAMKVRSGLYSPGMSFLRALEKDSALIRDSLYGANLSRAIGQLGAENILVVDFAGLRQDPKAGLSGIFRFLGVAPDFLPPEDVLHREYARDISPPKSALLNRTMKTVRRALEATGPGRLVTEALRRKGVVARVQDLNAVERELELSDEERAVFEDRIQDDARLFERLMGELPARLDQSGGGAA